MERMGFVKRTLLLVCMCCLLAVGINIGSYAEADAAVHPILYFFWGDGCPHCEKEKEFLATLHEKYPELEIRMFEAWKHPDFRKFADEIRKAYGIKTSSVPMTFLGDWSLTGFGSPETTGREIEEEVAACIQQGCADAMDALIPRTIVGLIRDQADRNATVGWERIPPERVARVEVYQKGNPHVAAAESLPSSVSSLEDNAAPAEGLISVPVLGSINVSKTGLPLFTIIIGGLDGFNPCAMWVLCFLLTLVIYAKSRMKILLIGGIFVLISGVIYFCFMAAWLNLFMLVGYVKMLRIAVAVAAIVMGLINCKDFFFFKQGISLTISESAQPKLFKRMRKVMNASALPGMILATIALAASANLIELLCTAGFPAIYTRVLTLQNLPVVQSYLYLALYNVVYVLPLAAIVSVFAWKMGGRKLTEKEGRMLKLVSGLLMLALGIIMIVKPELLTFG